MIILYKQQIHLGNPKEITQNTEVQLFTLFNPYHATRLLQESNLHVHNLYKATQHENMQKNAANTKMKTKFKLTKAI